MNFVVRETEYLQCVEPIRHWYHTWHCIHFLNCKAVKALSKIEGYLKEVGIVCVCVFVCLCVLINIKYLEIWFIFGERGKRLLVYLQFVEPISQRYPTWLFKTQYITQFLTVKASLRSWNSLCMHVCVSVCPPNI